MKRFPFRTAATVGIAAVLLGLSASPALAASTPPALAAGSSMYAVSCSGVPGLQLLSVDVSTAAATAIGSGTDIDGSTCATQSAWDAVTHTAYYSTWTGNPNALISVNPVTGDSTKIANYTLGDGTPATVLSIAIGTNGSAYALGPDELYSLDLATAALTPIAPMTSLAFGFAADPTSGAFYTIDPNGLISGIDVATGALTTIGQTTITPASGTLSLQIDSNGIMWVENGMNTSSDLWSVDPTDVAGSGILSGTIAVDGTGALTASLLIVPGASPAITSASPAGSIVAGSAFSFTVAASGTAPIAFSITAGALPTGLTLDPSTGEISGTPTTFGSFTYTVTATNIVGTTTADYTQVVTTAASSTPTTSDIHLPIVSG
jgi:hypothetical protein